ncbi:MAG: hemolysin family protein [Eubacteriales bacterium]
MDPSDVYQIIVLIILLIFSGLFSSAETALTTMNKMRIRTLADDGNKRAQNLLEITEDSGKLLTAILIGNNIVNLSASALTSTIAYSFGGRTVAFATGLLTLLILIFGEITPKTLATIHAEKLALAYSRPIGLFMKIMTPVIIVINKLSQGILLLCRVDPNAKLSTFTESELRTIVDVSHEDGVIESEEKVMIHNVFDLGDVKAKDIMVPRVHVTFAHVDTSYAELLEIYREDKFTRLPIYEETTDDVIGTINMKDLLLYENTETFHIRDVLREAYFTYEHKNISELLVEMRKSSFNIAVVLDEYGETAGLISLEDLLEEIVGEIHDEYDEHEEERIKKISDQEFVVEGSISLDDLNDELHLEDLNLDLLSEDYDSIGGLVIQLLDRLPDVGDEVVTENNIRIVVTEFEKNRIEHVHLFLPEPIVLDEE